jgi:hypothetical protein
MRQKNTPAGGRPGRGKSGESNRPHYTSLRFRLQAIEGHLLPFLIIVERAVKAVMR